MTIAVVLWAITMGPVRPRIGHQRPNDSLRPCLFEKTPTNIIEMRSIRAFRDAPYSPVWFSLALAAAPPAPKPRYSRRCAVLSTSSSLGKCKEFVIALHGAVNGIGALRHLELSPINLKRSTPGDPGVFPGA
jgi:hypothetical protein